MDSAQLLVMQIPLAELWDTSGLADAMRGEVLGVDDIAAYLRGGHVRFVIAEGGRPPATGPRFRLKVGIAVHLHSVQR
jgi:hypothetical protein